MDALLSKASSKSDSAASKSLGKKLVEGLGAKKDKVEKERRDRYNGFRNNLKWRYNAALVNRSNVILKWNIDTVMFSITNISHLTISETLSH